MPLTSIYPYDSLALVTSLTRVALGDFIQGIQPNNVGTVNTDATGYIVTWVSGAKFAALFNGNPIIVNGLPYPVAMVTSPTTLNLGQQAPANQAGSAYSLVIPTGDIFADSQAYVLPTINLAWRKLQKKLADKGHPRLENEATIPSIPITTNLDPISQQWISWTQFFDGTQLQPQPNLPGDFISPLEIRERQSVGAGVTNFTRPQRMHPAADGLRPRQKGSLSRFFDWREDALYFPGSILLTDWHLRYAAFLPDIVVAGGGFSVTGVPILRCAEALAQYSAAIFVTPRGSMLGPNFEAAGDAAVDQITNSYAKLQQRASYSRRPWGARGRHRSRMF